MNAISPTLPPEWIERLFTRFQSVYGSRCDRMWGKANPTDLHQTWAETLSEYSGDDIRDALDSLRGTHPEYPPTLFQFAGLCRDARMLRAQTVAKISGPRTEMPEDIRDRLRAFTKRVRAA